MNLVWIYLSGYLITLVAISLWLGRKQSDEDFLVANRDRRTWHILVSVFATTIGAGFFITYTGFAYEYGLGVFAILLGFLIGYTFYALWAAPGIRGSGQGKLYTLGQYIKERTSSNAARIASDILTMLVMLAWLVVGMIGGGRIVSEFGLLSYPTAIALFSLVVLAYVLIAGYRAVIITDMIQGVVLIVLLGAVTVGIAGVDVFSSATFSTFSLDLGVIIGFLIFGLFGRFSRGDLFQLVYASKDSSVAKRAFLWATIPVVLTCFFLLIIGVYMMLAVPGLDPALVFTGALKQFLPAALLPLAIVMFFAGVMSSADTNIYGIASHIAHYRKTGVVRGTRILAFLIVALVASFALLFPDVVDVSIIAGGINLILPPAVIYVLSGGRSALKVLASISAGVLGLVLGFISLGLTPAIAVFPLGFAGLGLLWPGSDD